jgi:uncharacterized protein
MSDDTRPAFANRLASEKSPYLRQHSQNPVDWHPWGEEAFAAARAAQKPIFLSVGYSTCHWCHVMAHESFENESIAQMLNRDFIPVKVDREERPDVDRVYMTYLQAATGQGGWPMSVWLTPDLEPFFGGTYFPPEDRWGRRGFATVLGLLAQAWADDREKLLAEGARVTGTLLQYCGRQNPKFQTPNPKRISGPEKTGAADKEGEERAQNPEPKTQSSKPEAQDSGPAAAALLASLGRACARCLEQLAGAFDAEWGGFGGAPKFPRAAVFKFLLRAPGGDSGGAVPMAAHTLRRMDGGGIHDHVGGGFHRYSVDEQWFVPHFEKMLHDQAQLAVCYLEAGRATGDPRHARVAQDVLDYVLRDLANPEGGFFSAEDADSLLPAAGQAGGPGSDGGDPNAEGAFYVWTMEDIAVALANGASALPKDGDLFCAHFDVQAGGNVPQERDPHGEFHGRNILRQCRPLAETARQFGLKEEEAGERLAVCLARLRAVRALRPRPQRDDKILSAWNGLMISALAQGYEVLEAGDGRDGLLGRPHVPARPAVALYLAAAVRTAEFLRRELYDEPTGVLYRSYREGRSDIPGFAEDYAYLIQGLLDLYEAAFDVRWLQWAVRLQAKMDGLFWDADSGGYFNSRGNDPSIIVRLKEDYDGAEPAPSSVAVMNLLRLDAMLGDAGAGSRTPCCRERAAQCLEAFRYQWERAPHALPQMLSAFEFVKMPPRTIVLAGDPESDDFRTLAEVARERAGPGWILLAADQGEGQAWLATHRPYLAEMRMIDGCATAYVCENFVCRPPTTVPEELRRMLRICA